MATKKTAAPKPSLPSAKALVAAWKRVARRAAPGVPDLLREVRDQPGTREALAAAYDAGLFPAEAFWRAGTMAAADLARGRVAPAVLAARPAEFRWALSAYDVLGVLLARCEREDPAALDAYAATADELDRTVIAIARAEATAPADGAPAPVRAAFARQFASFAAGFPALVVTDGEVTRVGFPPEAHRAALDATLTRIFGPHLAADLAAAQRADLAAYLATSVTAHPYRLHTARDALRLAAPALTAEEVFGFHSTFEVLSELSAPWGVDDLLRAADSVGDRRRPEDDVLANSLALLAVARDPACAPRAERHFSFVRLNGWGSPTASFALDALLRAPAAWRRHFALSQVFGAGPHDPVGDGPVALVLLASVDPAAAEEVAAEHGGRFDTADVWSFDPAALAALLDPARPALSRALARPALVGYGRLAATPPPSLDAWFALEGTRRDAWLADYLLALPVERAVAIVRREFVAGRVRWARAALGRKPGGASLLAAAKP